MPVICSCSIIWSSIIPISDSPYDVAPATELQENTGTGVDMFPIGLNATGACVGEQFGRTTLKNRIVE